MAFTAGALSQVSVTSVGDVLSSAVAVSGTTPYTYQWYRSTTSAFSPSTANLVSGATSLSLSDSSLTPGTKYYYKVIATDSTAGTALLATSTQLAVTTLAPSVSQNQFIETAFLGMTDLRFNGDTLSVQFDPAGSGTLVAGQAVKWSTVTTQFGGTNGGILVVPSTLQADVVCGFVNYDIKTASYSPGDRLEISSAGNVIYLYATAAVNRGAFLVSIPAAVAGGCNGGVVSVSGGSNPIVGYALDTGVSGSLIRVFLTAPSNSVSVG